MTTAAAERIGKYELLRRIGKGATSSVHLAWDPFRQVEVAIKRLRHEILSDPQRGRLLRQLFLNEAAFAARSSPIRSAAACCVSSSSTRPRSPASSPTRTSCASTMRWSPTRMPGW